MRPVGVNGPIIVDFTGRRPRWSPSGTGFTFTATGLDAAEPSNEAAFLGGGTYVNIHTAAFPGGAIRGQLFSAANVNLTAGTATGTTGIARRRERDRRSGGRQPGRQLQRQHAHRAAPAPTGSWAVLAPTLLHGDAGADVLVWSNGDGTDIMEGGADTDTVQVNGSTTANDVFQVAANGARLDFDRISPGPFSLDIGTTETLDRQRHRRRRQRDDERSGRRRVVDDAEPQRVRRQRHLRLYADLGRCRGVQCPRRCRHRHDPGTQRGQHLERDGRQRRRHRRSGGVVPLHRNADRRDRGRHLQRQGLRDRPAHRSRRRRRRYAQLRRRVATRLGRYDATGRRHRLARGAVGHVHADRADLHPRRQHRADDHPHCQSDHPGEHQYRRAGLHRRRISRPRRAA